MRIIAVHHMQITEAELLEMIEHMPPLPQGIAWHQSFCDLVRGVLFCEWEAPDLGALEHVFQAGEIPFDHLYPVRRLDVAKREFVD